MKLTFTVPGNPRPQQRHRTVRNKSTGASFQYDPSKQDKDNFLAKIMAMRPETPIEGPIRLEVTFGFQRPKSHFTKKGIRLTAPFYVEKRPDIDNLVKLVTDAMNGVFFRDDSQIVVLLAVKMYSDQPNVHIYLEQTNPGPHI